MDTSKEYILMCEKAREIQKLAKWDVGSWYWCAHSKRIIIRIQRYPFSKQHTRLYRIWLPRQDQLQLLSRLSWQEFDKECLKYNLPTKEQAGLQVVLKILDKTI